MCRGSRANFCNVSMHTVHMLLTFYDVDAFSVRGVLAGVVGRGKDTSLRMFCPSSTLH